MTIKESQAYSAMMVREFCYLFDMHKEGYEPTSDIEAVLYELEYGDSEAREIIQTCSSESKVEYLIRSKYSQFKWKVAYARDTATVSVSTYIPDRIWERTTWEEGENSLERTTWEEGENSLERIAALAVLEYCASRVA